MPRVMFNPKYDAEAALRRELSIGLEADRIMNADFDDAPISFEAYRDLVDETIKKPKKAPKMQWGKPGVSIEGVDPTVFKKSKKKGKK